jgi:hypothetical protein
MTRTGKLPKNVSTLLACLAISPAAFGKECDSELNGNLHKANENVQGNAELFLGIYNSNFKDESKTTLTPMLNLAGEVKTSAESSLFVNGSVKYKVPTDEEKEEEGESTGEEGKKGAQLGDWRIGLRDAYFRSKIAAVDAKLGFMTYTMGEQLLLDDRALGIDLAIPTSIASLRLFAAGVLDPFSREKQACISKNTFAPKALEEEEGDGETHEKGKGRNFAISKHFAGVRLEFGAGPHHEKPAATNSEEDEFETTSLEATNEQNTRYGLIYFVESKDDLSTFRHFPGVFGNTTIASIDVTGETAVQLDDDSSTLGYIGKINRSFVLSDARVVKLFSGYTAYHEISGERAFAPTYSNLFLGEAAQYLTKENNIAFAGAAYHPTNTLGLQAATYGKITDSTSSELDLSATYYYWEHSKLKLGGNWLFGDRYRNDLYQAYAEIRHLF